MSEEKKSLGNRRRFSASEKSAIVLRKFKSGESVSSICQDEGIQPSLFYSWQEQVLKSLPGLFSPKKPGRKVKPEKVVSELQAQVSALKNKLAKRDHVIAEVSQELVALKK